MSAGNAPLVRHLQRAFFAITVSVIVSALAGSAGIVAVTRSTDELIERTQPLLQHNAEIRASVVDASRGVRGYLLTGKPSFLDSFGAGRLAYEESLAQARTVATPADLVALEAQRSVAVEWFALYDDVSGLARAGGDDPRTVAVLEEGQALIGGLIADNLELESRVEDRQDRLVAQALRVRQGTLWAVISLGLLGLLSSVLIGRRATRTVTEPLADLDAALVRLTEGDLTARVAQTGPTEVRSVARAVNTLAERSQRLQAAEATEARLASLARGIGSRARDHVEVGRSAAEAVRETGQALGVQRAYVRFLGDGCLGGVAEQWCAPGYEPLAAGQPLAAAATAFLEAAYAGGENVAWPDVEAEVLTAGPEARDLVEVTGARAVITVPFGAGPDMLGTLNLVDMEFPRPWTAADLRFAETVASGLARGIKQASVFAQQAALVAELQALDRTKTEFLSTVSHELRTPLTSIAGYVELLRDGEVGALSARQDEILAVIERNAARLRWLIEDLLTLSRIESKAFRVSMVPVEVLDLVEAALTTVGPSAHAGGVALRLVVDPSVPAPSGAQVSGDAHQLERVMLNLLSNAVKFTPSGGQVLVGVALVGDQVVLTVSDTGIGVPEAEVEQLFTRFFRASTATERSISGTGLGLAIVRSIVEHHHGNLHLHSRVGEGTVLTVSLPALPALPAAGREVLPARGR